MSTLIAEPRADRNGKVVTRHIKNNAAPSTTARHIPAPIAPTAVKSEVNVIDDLNLMTKIGITDTSSGACEKVESYLYDEYGAEFDYDINEGVETISFASSEDADRFNVDYYDGNLREELRELDSEL